MLDKQISSRNSGTLSGPLGCVHLLHHQSIDPIVCEILACGIISWFGTGILLPESVRSNRVPPFRCIISTCQLQLTRSRGQLYIVKPRGAVWCGVALQLAPNGAPPSAASLVSVRAHPITPLSPLLFLRRRESPPNTLPCPLARTPRHIHPSPTSSALDLCRVNMMLDYIFTILRLVPFIKCVTHTFTVGGIHVKNFVKIMAWKYMNFNCFETPRHHHHECITWCYWCLLCFTYLAHPGGGAVVPISIIKARSACSRIHLYSIRTQV